MADLRYTEEEKRDRAYPSPIEIMANEHPYGCRISLDERELALIGVEKDDVPKVGDLMHFSAMARVTHWSDNEQGGRRVEMQIVEWVCMENETEESQEDDDDSE